MVQRSSAVRQYVYYNYDGLLIVSMSILIHAPTDKPVLLPLTGDFGVQE